MRRSRHADEGFRVVIKLSDRHGFMNLIFPNAGEMLCYVLHVSVIKLSLPLRMFNDLTSSFSVITT